MYRFFNHPRLICFFASVPRFCLVSRCVCMKVSGGVPRIPSIPESPRTASRVPDSQDCKPYSYPPPAHQLLPHSLINPRRLSGLTFFDNIHTWWYTRLDAKVWATSRHKDVWMSGSRNPNAGCCKGVLLRVRGLLTPECPAWEIVSVPSSFRYSTSRHLFWTLYPSFPSQPSYRFYVRESNWVFLLLRRAEESAP